MADVCDRFDEGGFQPDPPAPRPRPESADAHADSHAPAAVDPPPIIYGCDDQLRCTWPDAGGEPPWDESAVGRRDDELLDPVSAERLMRLKADAVQSDHDQRRELRLTIAGRPRTFDVRVVRQRPRDAMPGGLIVIAVDVTARTEAVARDRLLAAIDESARRTADAGAFLAIAVRLVAEHLDVDRAAWARVEPGGRSFAIEAEHRRRRGADEPAAIPLGRRHAMMSLSLAARAALRTGRPWAVDDARTHQPDAPLLAACRSIDLVAVAGAPARRAGRLAGAMLALDVAPRRWTDDELALLGRVAERCRQVVDRAMAERELRDGQQRLHVALDHARLGTWELDLDTGTAVFSDRFRAIFGLAPDASLDRDALRAMVVPEDRQIIDRAITHAVAEGAPFEVEYRICRPDGSVRTIRATGRVIEPAEPGAGGGRMVGISLDVTDQRDAQAAQLDRLEAERVARAEAERTSRIKDEFLATLSHELRTPLNAILGWAQLLRRRAPGPRELEQGLDTIERNAKLQAQLVEDLLDMSRIVSGKVRLEVRPVSLDEAVDAALAIARPSAEARHVRLERDVPDDAAGARVVADAGRLQQVLWNLVSNAIKFTPADGTVRVAVRRPHAGAVAVVVSDTGAGIAREFLPFVFERFRQADGSTRRAHSGLGLGLSIVKSLVEMHGGRVEVASDGPGRGATFTVLLPTAAPRFEPQAADAPIAAAAETPAVVRADEAGAGTLAGMRILVVDDDADARDLVRRLLVDHEADVTLAADVDQALAALPTVRPTVIVTDIGMAGRDGYDLIRCIRALDGPLSRTPAMALTAFARAADRSRALEAGFDLHLAKPVDAAELIAACQRLSCRVPRERRADVTMS